MTELNSAPSSAVGVASGLGRWPAFWIVTVILGLYFFAAAVPSPLYAVYAAQWHFSAIEVTEVFAVYVVALLVALLLTGSLSDSVGRRPVILAALVIQAASMLMFVAASNVEWLFAARVTQGIATGLVTSALAASLVDLQPAEHPTLAPVVNSSTPILALALGALASAALVQYAPDPLYLVFWLLLAAFLLAGVATVLMPEPTTRRGVVQLVPRVSVEAHVRPGFVVALPILVAGWAVGGFYLSLGPSLALELAASRNRVVGGFAIFVLAGVGAAAIVVLRTLQSKVLMVGGGAALTAGLALTVAAVAANAPAFFFASTAVTGVGFGIAWLGVLRSLVPLASPTSRAALLAAIFVVAYISFAVPAVIAGYLVTWIGLHDAALWYGGAACLMALAGLVGSASVSRT